MPYKKAEAIARTIRECCSQLDALEESLRQDTGITSAMRAALELLHERGAQTVPHIARARKVTRQHIQVIADRLLLGGLIRIKENPRDRRSPLLELTEQGDKVCGEMRERERMLLNELGRTLDDRDVEVTLSTLSRFGTHLGMKRALASRSRPADAAQQ